MKSPCQAGGFSLSDLRNGGAQGTARTLGGKSITALGYGHQLKVAEKKRSMYLYVMITTLAIVIGTGSYPSRAGILECCSHRSTQWCGEHVFSMTPEANRSHVGFPVPIE